MLMYYTSQQEQNFKMAFKDQIVLGLPPYKICIISGMRIDV